MSLKAVIVMDAHYGGLNPVQLGQQSCEPGYAFGPAVRTHWLLHYVHSGTGRFLREGVTYPVNPGEIFVIPPYLETWYAADEERPWKYTWIGFEADGTLPEILSRSVISCPEAGELFDEMLSCDRMENGRSAFLAGCLWKLMSLFLERGDRKPDYVDKAIHCMRSEYAGGITVQEVADRLGIDRSYFSALFSGRTGMPPSEYLVRLRLSRAAELMKLHGERPSTAAISVGYQDLYHFSRIFKKYYGLSPRSWMKREAEQAAAGRIAAEADAAEQSAAEWDVAEQAAAGNADFSRGEDAGEQNRRKGGARDG